MTETRITLSVDVPNVVEQPYRIEVRCGETAAWVYEHGHQGSGDWAAWKAPQGGHIIANGGKVDYPLEQALEDARSYVRRQERSRLLHAQLRTQLEARDGSE